IQAHPSKKQAEEGYERENREGIPLDAFNRNYKDDNHKPEIICAISEYWAMKGFRPAKEIREYFAPFCPSELESLLFSESGSSFHRTFFIALMNLNDESKKTLLDAALSHCRKSTDAACGWVVKLDEKYPGDISVLAPLYLNTIRLNPGEALYLPAGELHAYLQGFGMELMANSDNVLRGGLTSKFMDLKELEKTLLFESLPLVRIRPEPEAEGTLVYRTPSTEFELVRIDGRKGSVALDKDYPVSILAVDSGCLTVSEEGQVLNLKAGESCFLSGSGSSRRIEGEGTAFLARVPR
ncbi:MAG: mannose-6-phosphate isomerase, class I, partial [Spirochaetales bacterium]|nr:mannose-6-phosphate isomerase, class I [Spirochaetales bacterium]